MVSKLNEDYRQYFPLQEGTVKIDIQDPVIDFGSIISKKKLTLSQVIKHTRVYIYIYSHPQIECFVVSQLISVARYVGRLKLGSKPAQLYVRHSVRHLGQQAYHVG